MANYLSFNLYATFAICLILPLSPVGALSRPHSLFANGGNTGKAHKQTPFPQTILGYKESPKTGSLAEHGAIHHQSIKSRSFNDHEAKNSVVKSASTGNHAMPRNRRTEAHLKSKFSQIFENKLKSFESFGSSNHCPKSENCYRHTCKKKTTLGDECCHLQDHGYFNCSCCGLEEIPKVPDSESILYFDLSFNYLNETSLFNANFSVYTNLHILDLTCNNIRYIQEGTFNGLSNLQSLSLLWNYLSMDKRLNASEVFQPLATSLQTLILQGNNEHVSRKHLLYPDYALSFLTQLSTLWLDGLTDKTFGVYFSNLQNLQTLNLAGFCPGYCNLTSLNEDIFIHLNSLSFLNISDCHLTAGFLNEKALKPLTKLRSLDISNNFGLPFAEVGKLMFGLSNSSNFEYLRMNRIGTRFEPCVVVFESLVQNFRNMSLKKIEATDNNIEMIDKDVIKTLPRTLEALDLRNNKIMFGAYWEQLRKLEHLKELDLSVDNDLAYNFPKRYPSSKLRCNGSLKTYKKDKHAQGYELSNNDLVLKLPPQLKNVSMVFNAMAYNIGTLKFSDNNSLTEAYLQGNYFKQLTGPVMGLNSLKKLYLSDCHIGELSSQFLKHFPDLEYLDMVQNLLGDSIHADEKGHILSSMVNLKYLNLSFNNIFYISESFFIRCDSLETLDLSANRLHKIVFQVSHMANLSSLHLSKNNIFGLEKSTTDHIDKMFDATNDFKLDLRFNPIACDCSNLYFLKWLTSRKKILVGNISDYVCLFPDASRKVMPHGYDQIVLSLERQCRDNKTLLLVVASSTAFVIVMIILTVLYRFRWSLRYWFYTVKMVMSSNRLDSNTDFEYDAFICYAHEDEDFVVQKMEPQLSAQRDIRLMIHGQCFQAGRLIIDNILMAVRQCKRTLVVVTRSMLNSKWCLYELQMARMESINTNRNVLLFLFLETIPYKDIDLDIASYIRSNVVAIYPDNPSQQKVFWDRLAYDLKNA